MIAILFFAVMFVVSLASNDGRVNDSVLYWTLLLVGSAILKKLDDMDEREKT